jgi:uncharacterized protein YaiI (UPF0178 family)
VDFKLVNLVHAGDVVVTQDYGLAAMCLAKACLVINQDGRIYDEHNIEELLHQRHESKKLRKMRVKMRTTRKRLPEQNERFEALLTKLIKNV